jgi:hypothetical protein
MDATRTFTPARIIALALIAVVVAGLAYLRFAPDADPSPCRRAPRPAT